jgi:DNA-directed RNA polymerase specialized sigma24 family protein
MNSNRPAARKASQRGAFQRIVTQAFGLRPECREVFLLCGVQGCTIDEAAAILGINPVSATTRLDSARRTMNAELQDGEQERTLALHGAESSCL